MIRCTPRRLFILLGVLLLGGAPARAEPGAGPPPADVQEIGQPHYDRPLGATFRTGVAEDGSAWVGVQTAGLSFDKRVTAAGHTTIALDYRQDHVDVEMTDRRITVTRGTRSASLSRAGDDLAESMELRRLLLGSEAVRAFRAFTAALEQREGSDTSVAVSAMLDGALVSVLDGDQTAVERFARRVSRLSRATLRQAAFATGQFTDCVSEYERAILRAYSLLGSCYAQPTWLRYFLNYPFCSFEYLLRAEQYIFQFISCMAIP